MRANQSSLELPSVGIVSGLDEDERRILASYGEFFTVSADSVVVRQNEQQDSLYVVIEGKLNVYAEVDERNILLETLACGDSFGEVTIFDPGSASATVTTVERSRIWRIDRQALKELLEKNPGKGEKVLIQICTKLSSRLRTTTRKLAAAQEAVSRSFSWMEN